MSVHSVLVIFFTRIFVRPKTCSFVVQGALDLSTFSWVIQHAVILVVGIEEPVWVSGFCLFFPGALTSFNLIYVFC
jgi:hypothetical protein